MAGNIPIEGTFYADGAFALADANDMAGGFHVVTNYSDLATIVSKGRAYNGTEALVTATQSKYRYNGTVWNLIGSLETQTAPIVLYIDGTSGNDSSDGLTSTTRVKTDARLQALIDGLPPGWGAPLIIDAKGGTATPVDYALPDATKRLRTSPRAQCVLHSSERIIVASGTTSAGSTVTSVALGTVPANSRGLFLRITSGVSAGQDRSVQAATASAVTVAPFTDSLTTWNWFAQAAGVTWELWKPGARFIQQHDMEDARYVFWNTGLHNSGAVGTQFAWFGSEVSGYCASISGAPSLWFDNCRVWGGYSTASALTAEITAALGITAPTDQAVYGAGFSDYEPLTVSFWNAWFSRSELNGSWLQSKQLYLAPGSVVDADVLGVDPGDYMQVRCQTSTWFTFGPWRVMNGATFMHSTSIVPNTSTQICIVDNESLALLTGWTGIPASIGVAVYLYSGRWDNLVGQDIVVAPSGTGSAMFAYTSAKIVLYGGAVDVITGGASGYGIDASGGGEVVSYTTPTSVTGGLGSIITPERVSLSPGAGSTVNNYDRGQAKRLVIEGSGALTYTGFVPHEVGDHFSILSMRAGTITLKNADAGSLAANRLACTTSADIAINAGEEVFFNYLHSANTWVVAPPLRLLSTASPQPLGATAVTGVGTKSLPDDHVHTHGNQLGGTLHAVASGSAAGFISSADQTKLNGIATGADVTTSAGVLAVLATNTAPVALNGQNITSVGTVDGVSVSSLNTFVTGTLRYGYGSTGSYGSSHTPDISDAGAYTQYTGATSGTFTISAVGANPLNWAPGMRLSAVQTAAGQISFSAGAGVTLKYPSGHTPATRIQESEIFATYLGSNVWRISGDMA